MAQKRPFTVSALVFAALLSVPGWAVTPSPALIVTPQQAKWIELSTQQKAALAPLAADWDAMESYRRKKWIGIAQRFPLMTGDEQLRIQGQMQEWTQLTPEQRQHAREKYQTISQLPTEKKQELKQELKQKWEEYSNLPEEEKQKHQQQAVSASAPRPGRSTTTSALLPSFLVPPVSANPPTLTGAIPSAEEPQAPSPSVYAPTFLTPPSAAMPATVEADSVPRP